MDARREFEEKVRTALWDTGGETVEGAFVDRFESFSLRAIDELEELLSGRLLEAEEVSFIEAEIASPEVPLDQAASLLRRLAKQAPDLIRRLARAEAPHLRVLFHRVAGDADDTAGLYDPSPAVRIAALERLCRSRPRDERVDEALEHALLDADADVRIAAGRMIPIDRDPRGASALADLLERETNAAVKEAVLERLAEEVNRMGISASAERIEEGIGPRLRGHLIAALGNPSATVRERVARSLNRLIGEDVAGAMLDRLAEEQDPSVRGTLLLFGGYRQVFDRSFPILSELAVKGDDLARVRASFLLATFGAAAIAPLRRALADPVSRRPAAMSLGRVGDLSCLPDLVRAYGDPANASIDRELARAVDDVAIRAANDSSRDRPEPGPILRKLIDALPPRSWESFPVGAIKEMFDALPVMSTTLDVWSIRSDGKVVESDLDSTRLATEEIDDPLTVFAVYLRAAIDHPEMEPLLVPPPPTARVCAYCFGRGAEGREVCGHCHGLGWQSFGSRVEAE